MRDIVIDLGATDRGPEPEEAPQLTWLRPILSLLIVTLLTAGLAQSSPPAASPLILLGQVELDFAADSGVMIAGSGIITFHPDHGIVAHNLDGSLRWESRTRVVSFLQFLPQIIFYEIFLNGPVSREAMHMEARDPATGELLWRLPGTYGGHTDTLLFAADDGSDGTAALRVHDIRTGELAWSTPLLLSHHVPYYAEPAGSAVIGITTTHEYVEYELTTGQVRRTAQLELPAGESYLLYRDDDHVEIIVGRAEDANWTESVHWFDRESLDPLPRTEPDPEAEFVRYGEAPCGALTCRYEDRKGIHTTQLVDANGSVIRTLEPDRWLLDSAAGLLVVHNERTEELLDSHTGQPLPHHPGWRVLSGWPGDGLLLGDPRGDAQVYLAVLEAAGLRTLGMVPGPISNCTSKAAYLACQATDRRIHIWEIASRSSTTG